MCWIKIIQQSVRHVLSYLPIVFFVHRFLKYQYCHIKAGKMEIKNKVKTKRILETFSEWR